MAQLLQYYKRSFQQQPRTQASNLQPTFEDLSIDDKLSELQRLVRYSRSAIGLQRLVHVKMLAHIASNVGYWETSVSIFPLLDSISNDQEPAVRQHLMEQLALLAQLCCEKGGEDGYAAMISNILPIIAYALEDDKPEVRHAACSSLVSVSKLMQPEDLGQHVLTIVLQLAHEDEKEDRRMTAAELLNSLAENLGIDLCKQFVIPEVVSLAEDPVFRVRKSTALNFHNICKVGGEFELFERLMPAFVRLSKDDMYRVRRACADSIAEIAKYVSDDIRVGVLSEIYLRLTQDPSKLVKQSALQQSGMFIASLPCRAVNDSILGNFCSMAMSPTGDPAVDAELRRYCAYSFPAVLQTIGAGRWPEVRELYRALVQSRSCNVKKTLACSLHEVARILSTTDEVHGPNGGLGSESPGGYEDQDQGYNEYYMDGVTLVERELIPVFESMLQDEEVVQMGVMRHLAEFLGVLSVPCRVSYLPLLHDILHSTNLFNWRLRQCLAVQLPALLLLPPRELVFNTLFTLVMTLLQDPVASVRRDSFLGVAKMIMILSQQADFLSSELSKMDHKESLIETTSPVSAESAESPNMKRQLSEEKIRQNKLVRQQRHHIAITAAHHVDIVANAVQTLIQGRSYRLRQLWVELSHALLLELPQHLFEKHFLDGLLYLASDPVSNVRVAVAAVFAGWQDYKPPVEGNIDNGVIKSTEARSCSDFMLSSSSDEEGPNKLLVESSPWSWLLRRLDIAQCVMRLSVDHKDVYSVMVKLQPIFPHILFRAVSCKGRKEAPGGRNPVPNMNIGAFSQAATCVASPNALSSEAQSEGESGAEDEDAEGVDAASSEDDGSPTWEQSSNSFISIMEDDTSAQHDAPTVVDKRIGRSSDRARNGIGMLAAEYEKEPANHRDTPAYRGSPLNNYLNPADILITSISSPSRDGGPGYGVRSPSRKIDKSAILLQQQLEEIMQERNIHLEMRNSSSDGGDCTSPSESLSLGPPNLDAPIRAELELSLSPTSRRRMSPGASILERTLSRDDSDDEDDTDTELEERTSFTPCNRPQLFDNVFSQESESSSNMSGSSISAADLADRTLYMAPPGHGIKSGEQESAPASSSSILGLLSPSVDTNPTAETASAFSDPRSTIVHSIFGQSSVLCISDNAQDSLNVNSSINMKVTPLQSI